MLVLYIDPGSGSLLIQALLAAALSVPFFFRNTIRGGLRRMRRQPQEVDRSTREPAVQEISDPE